MTLAIYIAIGLAVVLVFGVLIATSSRVEILIKEKD